MAMNTIESVSASGEGVEVPENDELTQFITTLSKYVPADFLEAAETFEYKKDGGRDIFVVIQDENRSTDLGFAYGSAIADNGYALVGVHKHLGDTERANGFSFSPIIQTSDEPVNEAKQSWMKGDFEPLEEL